jgi:protein-S-isoprenylcysteine O-methyltransferase Ste14
MALIHELENQGNFLFRYRSYLPLLLFPPAFWVMAYNQQEDSWLFSTSQITSLEIAAIVICLFGLLIRVLTIGYAPANTSGRNTAQGQVADTINTLGMYSMVRHPLYVGNFFMWLGIAILTGEVWFILSFVLAYWLYYERIMFAEEQFLIRKFGDAYIKWSENTPAFIPKLSSWQKPSISFSWKKVLKKEKNGLFAIFLIVLIFDIWLNYLRTSVWGCEKPVVIYLAVGTAFLYFILKLIKSKTLLLDEEGR